MANEQKAKLNAMYKERYGLNDRQLQSWKQKAKNREVDFERYADYQFYSRNNSFEATEEEEKIIFHAETFADGILAVTKAREEKLRKEAEIRAERASKLNPLKEELIEVCKKHGATFLEEYDDIEQEISAPYAEDIWWNFDFAIKL